MAWIAYLIMFFCAVFGLFGLDAATRTQWLFLTLSFLALGLVLGGGPERPWRRGA